MEKRNWFKGINKDRYICGEDGTAIGCHPYVYIIIEPGYAGVALMTWHSGRVCLAEAIETEEELDSFIEALQKCKRVFHIREELEAE